MGEGRQRPFPHSEQVRGAASASFLESYVQLDFQCHTVPFPFVSLPLALISVGTAGYAAAAVTAPHMARLCQRSSLVLQFHSSRQDLAAGALGSVQGSATSQWVLDARGNDVQFASRGH